MTTAQRTHWPSLLILLTLGIGAALMSLVSLGMGISSIMDLFRSGGDPASEMIISFAYGFELFMVLICAWAVFERTTEREHSRQPIKLPYSDWQIFAVLAAIALAVTVGAAASSTEIRWLTWLSLPLLTLLVIVPPIWLIFGIGSRGIEPAQRWQFFSVLGLGMTIAPFIMIVLELAVLAVILVGSSVYIALQEPQLFRELLNIGRLLERETNTELILTLLGPYLKNPIVIEIVIGYMAVLIPLIEELLKPLAVWIFARKLSSPAQGFAMGMLSGAAFALVESLNASGDGSASWAIIVSVRAGTSLLHMTASGLVGWGIVSLIQEKRVARFFAAYLTSAAVHGLWNACAAGISIAALGGSIGRPDGFFNLFRPFFCGMIVLGAGMLAVLIASNRYIRRSLIQQPPPAQSDVILAPGPEDHLKSP